MNTSGSGEPPPRVAAVTGADTLAALGAETRTSAVLLGVSLGSMGLFALTLLLLTSWLAGR